MALWRAQALPRWVVVPLWGERGEGGRLTPPPLVLHWKHLQS
jgi:hypothetical protein